MRSIEASGVSDVGQVRESNEDAYLAGDSVFAVADGMGGHLAGEVASATALRPIASLDGRIFPDAANAVSALADAVVAANETVSRMAEDEPSYRGMGTTLTAALIEGRRLHVAHVGDSRAYLLRDAHFSQLTDDHTLVQHLIDEGQITREEAENHPQRSIITRAIGVSPSVDVDSMSLDLEPDDQLLLCSDGLTGVVPDEEIAQRLADDGDVETTVRGLVDAANEAGGPDNITVILVRYHAADDHDGNDDRAPAPAPATVAISTLEDRTSPDWAGRLGSYGTLGKTSGYTSRAATTDGSTRTGGRIVMRTVAILIGLVVLGGLLVAGGQFLLAQQYFVGLDEDDVVIYQGVDAQVGPLDLARIVERTRLSANEVPPWYRSALEDGVPAADLNDARRIVDNAPRRADTGDDQPTDPGDAEDPGGDAVDPDVAP